MIERARIERWCEYLNINTNQFALLNIKDKQYNKTLSHRKCPWTSSHQIIPAIHVPIVNVKRSSQNEIETSAKLFKWSFKCRQYELWTDTYHFCIYDSERPTNKIILVPEWKNRMTDEKKKIKRASLKLWEDPTQTGNNRYC